MNPAVGALSGGAATLVYIPFLRSQIRDGEISIPFGPINPIRIRRADHPLLFRACVAGMIALMTLILGGCAIVLLKAIMA